jgi:hypothetical protein
LNTYVIIDPFCLPCRHLLCASLNSSLQCVRLIYLLLQSIFYRPTHPAFVHNAFYLSCCPGSWINPPTGSSGRLLASVVANIFSQNASPQVLPLVLYLNLLMKSYPMYSDTTSDNQMVTFVNPLTRPRCSCHYKYTPSHPSLIPCPRAMQRPHQKRYQ